MEQTTTMNLPVLALRGTTIFPRMMMSIDVEREISVRALERAMENDEDIFLVAQREVGTALPGEADLYAVGTVSRALNGHPNVSEKARTAILAAAQECGFQLNQNAKQLKQIHSTNILLVVKGTRNDLFAEMIEAI